MATINSGSIGDMYLQIDYTVTSNTANNTSTVRATLKLVNHYALYATAIGGSYLSVGGQKVDYSKAISYGGSATTTTTLYGPRDFVITHNNDGTASCNLTGTFVMNGTYRGYPVGTMTVSQTIALPTIARSSSFTVSSSVNTGSAISGTITPSSSAFNHKVLLKIGSSTKHTISLAAGTNSFSYTIPHSWFPSSTSGTITAELQTYSGTTLVAATSKNITANVPPNIGPSISSFTVASLDGMNGLSIRGRSRVRLTANATPGSGATMATYTFVGNNVNATDGSSSRVVYSSANTSTIDTGVFNYIGAATYTIVVADTRGRTATRSLGIEVFEYSPPSILSMSVQRCTANGTLSEDGTYAYVTVSSHYTTLYHNNTNYNTRTVVLTNNANSLATTVQNVSNTNGSWAGVYGNGTFAAGTTYTITATIKDTAYNSTASMSQPLKAASRPMNIKANGKGVGFGKMAETDNLLDVQWDERVRGNLQVDGTIVGGLAKDVSNGNWNTACGEKSGFYMGSNMLNAPTTGWWYVQHIAHNNMYKVQIAHDFFSNVVYKRICSAGTWGGWTHYITNDLFASLYSQNGYAKLSNGLIIQWGLVQMPANLSSADITYPIAFPTAVRAVTCQNSYNNIRNCSYSVATSGTTGFKVFPYISNSDTVPTVPVFFYWMAVGH